MGAQSGLQTHIVATGVALCVLMKSLTAFVELEVAIRARQSAQGIAERME